MKNKNREVQKMIFSIINVSLFLVVMTVFVYLPKQETLLSSLAFLQNQQKFYMEDLSDGILLKEANPTQDSKGLELEPYKFKVTNNSKSKITYRIVFKNDKEYAETKGKEVLPNKYLRYSINEIDTEEKIPATLTEDGIIYETTIEPNSSTIFEFRMWLDYDCDNGAMNKIFIGKIEIEEIK